MLPGFSSRPFRTNLDMGFHNRNNLLDFLPDFLTASRASSGILYQTPPAQSDSLAAKCRKTGKKPRHFLRPEGSERGSGKLSTRQCEGERKATPCHTENPFEANKSTQGHVKNIGRYPLGLFITIASSLDCGS